MLTHPTSPRPSQPRLSISNTGSISTVPPVPPEQLVDRPELTKRLRKLLSARRGGSIVLVGAGGMGKSTLASAMVADPAVQGRYADGIHWLTIEPGPDAVLDAQRRLAARLPNCRRDFKTAAEGLVALQTALQDTQTLLILDNLDAAGFASSDLLVTGPKGRLLITARSTEELSLSHKVQELKVAEMTAEQAQELLALHAEEPDHKDSGAGRLLVRQCAQVPLAIVLTGSALRQSQRWATWSRRFESLDGDHRLALAAKKAGFHPAVFNALAVSVQDLESEELAAYRCLSIFPAGQSLPPNLLQALWYDAQQDREEAVARAHELSCWFADRMLLHLGEDDSCRLDPVHVAYLRSQIERNTIRRALHQQVVYGYQRLHAPDGWHTLPDDGYISLQLGRHFAAGDMLRELAALMMDYRWLRMHVHAGRMQLLLDDFSRFTGIRDEDEPLNDDMEILGRSIADIRDICSRHPQQLAFQLAAQLDACESERLRAWVSTIREQEEAQGGWTLWPAMGCTITSVSLQQSDELDRIRQDPEEVGVSSGLFSLPASETTTWRPEPMRHPDAILALSLTPDGSQIASGSKEKLCIWSRETQVCVREWQANTMVLAMPGQGEQVVSAGSDWGHALKLWDVADGSCIRTFTGHGCWITALTCSADGKRLVSGDDSGVIKVWDINTGSCLHSWTGHEGWITGLAMSANGRRLVTSGFDRTVKVYDVTKAVCMATLDGHAAGISALAITADGSEVVTGSSDKTVKIWHMDASGRSRTLEGHSDAVTDVCLSPDDELLASVGKDKTVKIWNRQSGTLLTSAVLHHRPRRIAMAKQDGVMRLVIGDEYGQILQLTVERPSVGVDLVI